MDASRVLHLFYVSTRVGILVGALGDEPATAPRGYDVSYSDPPVGALCFSCEDSEISARRSPLAPAAHALPGPPDGAGLLLMDPAEVPNQLESRRRAAATTSQLFSAAEDGVSRESTVKVVVEFFPSF